MDRTCGQRIFQVTCPSVAAHCISSSALEFRRCVYDDYYLSMLALSHSLLEAFALSLSLPGNYFREMFDKPMVTMRLLYYPCQPVVTDEDQLGCGAHTDYECFTILSQSNAEGLQVMNKRGQWIKALPLPGTFVVNIGDLMQRWTNDRFRSTVHRVINTSGRARYSVPLFFGPNYFTRIESLMNDPSNSYAPIVAGDYLTERFDQTYRYREK